MNKNIIIIFVALFTLSFKVGDEVELTQFLNARTRPSFIKSTKVANTLISGTTGTVSNIKKFYSGNMGIQMKLTSGPHSGKTYWVYYNTKSPGMVLTNGKSEQISQDKVNEELLEQNNKINSLLTEKTNGILDPKESILENAVNSPIIANNNVKEALELSKPPCAPSDTPALDTETPQAPLVVNDRPKNQYDYPICSTRNNSDFSSCVANGNIEEFAFSNYGPNAINPKNQYYIDRHFSVNLNDRSLSDSSLMITDNPNETTSASTYSMMMFFPRKQLPSVTSDGNKISMTLSNGELVEFNAKTKEIIGGVMKESPMEMNARKRALPAKVNYTGEGVLIRADRNNGYPIGDDEDSKGRAIPNRTVAVISKRGFKNCKIPSAELWYSDQVLNRTLLKKEYSTDEGLDKLLKSRCGFTIN